MKTLNEEAVNSEIVPKRDVVFKHLFGSKKSESDGTLKSFLEAILEIKIDSVTITLPTEMLPQYADGKVTRVDVRAKLSDGTNINVEMQSKSNEYSDRRCLQHWCDIYSNNIQKGDKYTDLKKTICIWIMNENVMKETKDYETRWQIADLEHNITNRFTDIEFYIFELKKFRKNVKLPLSDKELWLSFIDHTNREWVDMACNKRKEIEEARKHLEKLRADPKMQEAIYLEDAYRRDVNTAISNAEANGRAEGENKEKTKIAKKLKSKGIDINTISEVTGLSLDEITKLE